MASIRDLAQEIAELNRAHDLAQKASAVSAEAESQPDPIGSRASLRTTMFRWLEETSHRRSDQAARLMLTCEPESIDDVLSLLLVFAAELGHFTANNVPAFSAASPDPRNHQLEHEYGTLEAALRTAIAGLIRHGNAASPLLEDFGAGLEIKLFGLAQAIRGAEQEIAPPKPAAVRSR
jgi:hypothetical protein